jgi:hypothetical protein
LAYLQQELQGFSGLSGDELRSAGEGIARAKQMAAKREALRDRTLDYRFVVAAAARNVNESIDHEIVFI